MFETTKTTNGNAKFTYGFLTGGLIVGSLALLFAPKKGKALRRNISMAANNLSSSISDKAGEYLNSAGEYLNTAKEKTTGLLSDGKDKLEKTLVSSEKTIKSKTK
jgi:gas vesicle protein